MFLSLGLLDMLMDKCATAFHAQIGTKDFMQVLIVILNDKQVQQEVSTRPYLNRSPKKSCI
jgi:hypothetical protein